MNVTDGSSPENLTWFFWVGPAYIIFVYCCLLQVPLLVAGLERQKVLKISAHVDGSHYMALTSDGSVYSWGCGDCGQLGHGSFR